MAEQELRDKLITYLTDVHSTEQNAVAQLKTGVEEAGDQALKDAFREHLAETEQQERLIRERLESYGETPSALKDLAQKGGALLSGTLAKSAEDTTGKLAIQAYAFEHLEIASYRMLAVVAEQAGDQDTLQVARQILEQERHAAQRLDGLLEQVADFDLHAIGAAS